jgi:hypothetical protein
VRAVAVGLLVEEQRSDVAEAWKRAVDGELEGDAALAYAVGPLLREMGLALRGEGDRGETLLREGGLRSAVLVRSGAAPPRVAREFKLLHRALWDTLRAAGCIVGADERRAADEWLDEALAVTLDRLDRVRLRADLLDRAPPPVARATQPERAQRPPPLPSARLRAVPPPLPVTATALE